MVAADTVFVNGRVVTVDKRFSFKKAIAIKNGWIINVGENADIRPYIGPHTQVIDLQGKMILPGAHDSHCHGIVYGTNHLTCDCSYPKIKTISDLQEIFRHKAQETPPGKWLRGNGLNPENIIDCKESGRPLTRRDLDEVTPHHPVIILNWSGHSILVNSKALEVCSIDELTPDPPTGVMERDADGLLTGVCREAGAISLISKNVPLWTNEEIRSSILAFQQLLNQEGYTSYTESTLGPAGNLRDSGAGGERGIAIYKQLLDEEQLTARVSIGFYSGQDGAQSYAHLRNDLDTFRFPELKDSQTNWLNIPMIKIFADGVHIGHTAWLIDDYTDQPGFHGRSCLAGATDEEQEEELHRMILLAHERGWQVGIHTIGDRAIRSSLDGFIKAMQAMPGKNPRHYLIHPEAMITNEMARKAAEYTILMSVQPGLADYLFEPSLECIGSRGKRAFGLKELLYYGVVLAGGSDSLNGDYCNWRQAIESAVTRRSRISGKIYSPELALTVEEGIRLYTYNGAYQENFEHVRGSIEIGKVADLQVLDQDIFMVDSQDIGKIKVVMTMVGGKIVYTKGL